MTTLYLVPLPFGNPDDISLRALRILREADAVAAVEVETARAFLAQHEISRAVIAYGDALAALAGGSVALVAPSSLDAAAQEIVREAIARGFRVEPLPGADAAITALVLSGLSTEAFVYIGALPDDLPRLAVESATLIFTSGDLVPALGRLFKAFGDRALCVAFALMQPAEIVYRATLEAALVYFEDHPIAGEVLLVVAGAPPATAVVWDREVVLKALRGRLAAGEPLKLAAKAVANEAGWDRRTVYALGVEEKGKTP